MTVATVPEPPRGALERALGLLDLLASDLPNASLSDLARATGLSMSTTSRLLGTLIQAGLVERDGTRTYTLGPRLVELGRRATETRAVTSLSDVRPVRDDAVAVLGRELAEARDGLTKTLTELVDEGRLEAAEQVGRLREAASAEQSWYDCAKIIAASPGATVGAPAGPADHVAPASYDAGAVRSAKRQATAVRQRTLGLLDRLDPEALSRVGTHRAHGPVSVLQCLQQIATSDHDLRAALVGKPVSPREPRAHGSSPSITHERRVLLHHVNMRGIVTTVAMLIYLEEAEAALLRSLGLLDFAHRFSRIYFEIQHRRPSYYDDVVTVHLMVNRVGATSVHYDFTIFNGGTVAAFGKWGLCMMDEAGQPTTIPPAPRQALLGPRHDQLAAGVSVP
jgi:acyl-CoA thioesterase FadM/DNA-binding transcriptional ArsR family regulator